MLFYNFKVIYNAAKGDCDTIITIFEYLCGMKTNPSKADTIMLGKLKGKSTDSYIIDPENLLISNYASSDICMYIMLASYRNYTDYTVNNVSSLPIFIIDDIFNIKKLKRNKLLYIDDNMIHFKY